MKRDNKAVVSTKEFVGMLTKDMSAKDIEEAMKEGEQEAEQSIENIKNSTNQN